MDSFNKINNNSKMIELIRYIKLINEEKLLNIFELSTFCY